MRGALIGVLMALSFGGSALASDFIVVNSTDPAIKKGTAVDAGARLAVAPGATLTLIRASGEITTLKGAAAGVAGAPGPALPGGRAAGEPTPLRGAPAGVTVRGARLAAADAAKFESLRALLQPPPEGRPFGARRGGVCPPVESLTALDDI